MDIETIKRERDALAEGIKNMIRAFERRNGVEIHNVEIMKSHSLTIGEPSEIVAVNIDIRL